MQASIAIINHCWSTQLTKSWTFTTQFITDTHTTIAWAYPTPYLPISRTQVLVTFTHDTKTFIVDFENIIHDMNNAQDYNCINFHTIVNAKEKVMRDVQVMMKDTGINYTINVTRKELEAFEVEVSKVFPIENADKMQKKVEDITREEAFRLVEAL